MHKSRFNQSLHPSAFSAHSLTHSLAHLLTHPLYPESTLMVPKAILLLFVVLCASSFVSSVAKHSDRGHCSKGQVSCGGKCFDKAKHHACCTDSYVNLLSDSNNCRSCGSKCGDGKVCCSGNCVKPDHCCDGNAAASSSADHTTCSAVYDFATDFNNCGSCGKKCGKTETCCEGSCIDFRTSGCCNGKTTPTVMDSNNCGRCNRQCKNGETCCDSTCLSAKELAKKLKKDKNNCGKCGNACGKDELCCNSACLSTSVLKYDNENCGRCGHACKTGKKCTDGRCKSL